MTSKKKPASKRANLPRSSSYTREFLKDWIRLTHSGRYDMNRLKRVMILLVANDGPLAAEWLDHPLAGSWAGRRECHVGGDFLLAYQIDEGTKCEEVVFVRAGTHSELFE